MKNLAGAPIAARMQDCFARQIAAFERMLADLAMLDRELGEEEIEALASLQERHSVQANALAREFRALFTEWEATAGIPAADRAAVGRSARRSEKLAAQLDKRCTQGDALVQERMQTLRRSLDEVATGRELLQRYSPAPPEPPSYLDRKA